MKKVLLLMLLLVLCIGWTGSLTVKASAAENTQENIQENIQENNQEFWVQYGLLPTPYYTHTNSVTLGLEFSPTGKVIVVSAIDAQKFSYTTKTVARLQQKVSGSYKTLNTWTQTGDSSDMLSEIYYITKGYSYKLSSTFYVYENGKLLETINEDYERFYE